MSCCNPVIPIEKIAELLMEEYGCRITSSILASIDFGQFVGSKDGVATNLTIKGELILDDKAKSSFCSLVQSCVGAIAPPDPLPTQNCCEDKYTTSFELEGNYVTIRLTDGTVFKISRDDFKNWLDLSTSADNNTTNVSLAVAGETLNLTDSDGKVLSVPLVDLFKLTDFSANYSDGVLKLNLEVNGKVHETSVTLPIPTRAEVVNNTIEYKQGDTVLFSVVLPTPTSSTGTATVDTKLLNGRYDDGRKGFVYMVGVDVASATEVFIPFDITKYFADGNRGIGGTGSETDKFYVKLGNGLGYDTTGAISILPGVISGGGGTGGVNTYVDGGSFTPTSLDLTRTDGAVVSIALPDNNCVQKIHEMTSAGTLPAGHDIYLLSEVGNYAMPPAISVPIGTQFTLVHNVPTGGDIVIHNNGMVLTNMIAPYGGGHALKGFNAVATVTCISEGVYRIWGQAE